ncbi:MAG: twin-arginine translocase TatA/TatE family subunit [Nanohaloarchaea archaeon]|nr:twin-arginine translocase TatA/TatE family subunit [Candidatus Nanohaloarchaea archaeon]
MVLSPGLGEIVLIGAAVLFLIMGPKKLPQFARSLGESKKEFKKSMNEAQEVVDEAEEVGEEMRPDAESEVEDIKSSSE